MTYDNPIITGVTTKDRAGIAWSYGDRYDGPEKPQYIVRSFGSYFDLLDHVDLTVTEWPEFGRNKCSSHRPSKDQDRFFGDCRTFAEAISRMRTGWPEGLASMNKETQALAHEVSHFTSRHAIGHSVVGYAPNVGRCVQGRPDNMFKRTASPDRPVVQIVVAIGGNSGVNAATFLARGAAVMALIEAVESSGREVELIAISAVEYGTRDMLEMRMLVKSAGQYVEPDRLAFVLSHPSFQRRILFAVKELLQTAGEPWMKRALRQSMGTYGYAKWPRSADLFEADLYIPTLGAMESGNWPKAARLKGYQIKPNVTLFSDWRERKPTIAWLTKTLKDILKIEVI